MSQVADPSGITEMVAKATSALAALGPTSSDSDADPPSGSGSAANGMITVRASMPGRITSLALDPRVMRLPSATLAEEIERAVNEALADLQRLATAAGGPADLSVLGDQLREIQQGAVDRLSAYSAALLQAQERIAARGGRP